MESKSYLRFQSNTKVNGGKRLRSTVTYLSRYVFIRGISTNGWWLGGIHRRR